MISINKLLLILAFLTLGYAADCQTKGSGYRLVFTDGNHAEGWAMGVASVYVLTDTSLTFRKQPKSSQSDSMILITADSEKILDEIKSIKWDSLSDWYHNQCVMATSGEEYFLSIKADTTVKKISLHHYYLKEIAHLTDCLNKILPQQYKIEYLSPKTKQDCNLDEEYGK